MRVFHHKVPFARQTRMRSLADTAVICTGLLGACAAVLFVAGVGVVGTLVVIKFIATFFGSI